MVPSIILRTLNSQQFLRHSCNLQGYRLTSGKTVKDLLHADAHEFRCLLDKPPKTAKAAEESVNSNALLNALGLTEGKVFQPKEVASDPSYKPARCVRMQQKNVLGTSESTWRFREIANSEVSIKLNDLVAVAFADKDDGLRVWPATVHSFVEKTPPADAPAPQREDSDGLEVMYVKDRLSVDECLVKFKRLDGLTGHKEHFTADLRCICWTKKGIEDSSEQERVWERLVNTRREDIRGEIQCWKGDTRAERTVVTNPWPIISIVAGERTPVLHVGVFCPKRQPLLKWMHPKATGQMDFASSVPTAGVPVVMQKILSTRAGALGTFPLDKVHREDGNKKIENGTVRLEQGPRQYKAWEEHDGKLVPLIAETAKFEAIFKYKDPPTTCKFIEPKSLTFQVVPGDIDCVRAANASHNVKAGDPSDLIVCFLDDHKNTVKIDMAQLKCTVDGVAKNFTVEETQDAVALTDEEGKPVTATTTRVFVYTIKHFTFNIAKDATVWPKNVNVEFEYDGEQHNLQCPVVPCPAERITVEIEDEDGPVTHHCPVKFRLKLTDAHGMTPPNVGEWKVTSTRTGRLSSRFKPDGFAGLTWQSVDLKKNLAAPDQLSITFIAKSGNQTIESDKFMLPVTPNEERIVGIRFDPPNQKVLSGADVCSRLRLVNECGQPTVGLKELINTRTEKQYMCSGDLTPSSDVTSKLECAHQGIDLAFERPNKPGNYMFRIEVHGQRQGGQWSKFNETLSAEFTATMTSDDVRLTRHNHRKRPPSPSPSRSPSPNPVSPEFQSCGSSPAHSSPSSREPTPAPAFEDSETPRYEFLDSATDPRCV